jgi:hypothetical protein
VLFSKLGSYLFWLIPKHQHDETGPGWRPALRFMPPVVAHAKA